MTTLVEAGRTRVEVPDFDSWVAARGPALLRLAYVLTGNAADAEDVVQDALSRALPRWDRISRVGRRRLRPADGDQRQHLVVAQVPAPRVASRGGADRRGGRRPR